MLDISKEPEHESFESTFNYCFDLEDNLHDNNKLIIEENQTFCLSKRVTLENNTNKQI